MATTFLIFPPGNLKDISKNCTRKSFKITFNNVIEIPSFPDSLKFESVCSPRKPEANIYMGKYRPISVISKTCKVFESIIEEIMA